MSLEKNLPKNLVSPLSLDIDMMLIQIISKHVWAKRQKPITKLDKNFPEAMAPFDKEENLKKIEKQNYIVDFCW